jgi:ABC-type multidrug transport system ATPase subunit
VLELQDVSLFVNDDEAILSGVSLKFPRRHFAAIIGPSGCGKSTLLKTIAGIAPGREEGGIHWDTRDLMEHDFAPSEIGYVPQFSIAHEELTARECVATAVKLRRRGSRGEELETLVENTLDEVGLLEFADRLVNVLSGGQKRRLALAMEIASAPAILLCDEVTSGLDAQAENEVVHLLHGLAEHDRLVLSVTHSLRHLDLYDSVAVLHRGVLAYHGPTAELAHYFRVENLEDLYGRLEEREPEDWSTS